MESVHTVDTYINVDDLLPSGSYSEINEQPCKNLSERLSKRFHRRRRSKDLERHSSSFEPSKNKSGYCLESKVEYQDLFTHKCDEKYRREQDSGTEQELSVEYHEASIPFCDKELPVISLGNERFQEAVHYRMYPYASNLSCYDREVSKSVAKIG